MSSNTRKRKHRGPNHPASSSSSSSSRPKLNNHDSHSTTNFPAFLSHHDAYQASLVLSSSSKSTPSQSTEQSHVNGHLNHQHEPETEIGQDRDPLQALYIQAHEADIIRGSGARIAAESLEVVEYVPVVDVQDAESESDGSKAPVNVDVDVKAIPKIGSALIQIRLHGAPRTSTRSSNHWRPPLPAGTGAGAGSTTVSVFDEDDDSNTGIITPMLLPHESAQTTAQSIPPDSIWVDRYDARLLLDSLQLSTASAYTSTPLSPTFHAQERPSSPTGWSDLPSDTEDTFFFDPAETQDFRREKRRKLLERTREERLRARREEDGDGQEEEEGEGRQEEEEEVWGGSDEEPEQPQKDLMSRTATHLLSSPNPAQLEMRILANHGRDRRFAFLRGRWARSWGLVKAKARVEMARERERRVGLGVLAGYGSDSSEEGEERKGEDDGGEEIEAGDVTSSGAVEEHQQLVVSNVVDVDVDVASTNAEERAKEARRNKLKAWVEQRNAARNREKDAEY